MPFGVPIARKIGFRLWCLIGQIIIKLIIFYIKQIKTGALVFPGSILASSWMKNFWAFSSTYGILIGMVFYIIKLLIDKNKIKYKIIIRLLDLYTWFLLI